MPKKTYCRFNLETHQEELKHLYLEKLEPIFPILLSWKREQIFDHTKKEHDLQTLPFCGVTTFTTVPFFCGLQKQINHSVLCICLFLFPYLVAFWLLEMKVLITLPMQAALANCCCSGDSDSMASLKSLGVGMVDSLVPAGIKWTKKPSARHLKTM